MELNSQVVSQKGFFILRMLILSHIALNVVLQTGEREIKKKKKKETHSPYTIYVEVLLNKHWNFYLYIQG